MSIRNIDQIISENTENYDFSETFNVTNYKNYIEKLNNIKNIINNDKTNISGLETLVSGIDNMDLALKDEINKLRVEIINNPEDNNILDTNIKKITDLLNSRIIEFDRLEETYNAEKTYSKNLSSNARKSVNIGSIEEANKDKEKRRSNIKSLITKIRSKVKDKYDNDQAFGENILPNWIDSEEYMEHDSDIKNAKNMTYKGLTEIIDYIESFYKSKDLNMDMTFDPKKTGIKKGVRVQENYSDEILKLISCETYLETLDKALDNNEHGMLYYLIIGGLISIPGLVATYYFGKPVLSYGFVEPILFTGRAINNAAFFGKHGLNIATFGKIDKPGFERKELFKGKKFQDLESGIADKGNERKKAKVETKTNNREILLKEIKNHISAYLDNPNISDYNKQTGLLRKIENEVKKGKYDKYDLDDFIGILDDIKEGKHEPKKSLKERFGLDKTKSINNNFKKVKEELENIYQEEITVEAEKKAKKNIIEEFKKDLKQSFELGMKTEIEETSLIIETDDKINKINKKIQIGLKVNEIKNRYNNTIIESANEFIKSTELNKKLEIYKNSPEYKEIIDRILFEKAKKIASKYKLLSKKEIKNIDSSEELQKKFQEIENEINNKTNHGTDYAARENYRREREEILKEKSNEKTFEIKYGDTKIEITSSRFVQIFKNLENEQKLLTNIEKASPIKRKYESLKKEQNESEKKLNELNNKINNKTNRLERNEIIEEIKDLKKDIKEIKEKIILKEEEFNKILEHIDIDSFNITNTKETILKNIREGFEHINTILGIQGKDIKFELKETNENASSIENILKTIINLGEKILSKAKV